VKGRTLIIADPMLATGGSMAAAIEALLMSGKPKKIHVCCVIAAPEGIEVVKESLPDDATIWCASVDQGMNEHKYIVPLNRNPLPHFLIPADHSSVAGDEKAGAGKEEYQCIRSTLQEGG
jgi:hypothetical protein